MTRRLESPDDARARLAAESLNAEERARLWHRIDNDFERHLRRKRRALLAAPLAVAVAAGLVWIGANRVVEPAASGVDPACVLDAKGQRWHLPAHCGTQRLQIDGDEWQLSLGAELARIDDGVRVVQGQVRFRARPRTRESLRVHVSHGEVRVIGTVFQVEQYRTGGKVTVSEGVIEFVWLDGARERVAAGRSLQWPRPTPEAAPQRVDEDPGKNQADAPPEPAAEPAKSSSPPATDVDSVVERLLQLQSQRRFTEAVTLLQQALNAPGMSGVQRERISYQLGLSLEASGRSACAHWEHHVRRFGSRLHAVELAKRLERCKSQ